MKKSTQIKDKIRMISVMNQTCSLCVQVNVKNVFYLSKYLSSDLYNIVSLSGVEVQPKWDLEISMTIFLFDF